MIFWYFSLCAHNLVSFFGCLDSHNSCISQTLRARSGCLIIPVKANKTNKAAAVGVLDYDYPTFHTSCNGYIQWDRE